MYEEAESSTRLSYVDDLSFKVARFYEVCTCAANTV